MFGTLYSQMLTCKVAENPTSDIFKIVKITELLHSCTIACTIMLIACTQLCFVAKDCTCNKVVWLYIELYSCFVFYLVLNIVYIVGDYRKVPKFSDARNFGVIHIKFKQTGQT